ncbi:MAG: DUF2500 domain-containing protein [Methanimicrococcus sp.]|nr:DUF2500 domain-containing protein [Methanimicrococcus sp.]
MRAVAKWKTRKGDDTINPIYELIFGFIALGLGFIIVIACFVAFFIVGLKEEAKQGTLPVKTVKATVKSNDPLKTKPGHDRRMLVTFETKKGILKFGFSSQEYSTLNLKDLRNGDDGTLRYRGTQYIDFTKDSYEW